MAGDLQGITRAVRSQGSGEGFGERDLQKHQSIELHYWDSYRRYPRPIISTIPFATGRAGYMLIRHIHSNCQGQHKRKGENLTDYYFYLK